MKDNGWRFVKINAMTIYFCNTTELNETSDVKIPLRYSAYLIFENEDKYCFLWSILAIRHPCKNYYPNSFNL